MNHLSTKPFTKINSTLKYNPEYLNENRDIMKLFSNNKQNQPNGRYMTFHNYSRRQYDTQNLI